MPPPGLTYAGQLYTASGGTATNESKQTCMLHLPQNVRIDRTFQQPGGLVTSGGGATSPLGSGDIPKGFYVECSGSDTHGRRWAVIKPYDGSNVLKADVINDDDSVRQYSFSLGLYADTGRDNLGEGASTKVDVWYKART